MHLRQVTCSGALEQFFFNKRNSMVQYKNIQKTAEDAALNLAKREKS